MNEDILKGKWQEIKGGVKEKWGKLIDNHTGEIEGKSEKLLGLLRQKYGYIKEKTELEYKDTVELAEIVSHISRMMKEKDFMAIAFIARYGQPLSAKNQESEVTGVEKRSNCNNDLYFNSRLPRRTARLALP